MKYDFDFKEDDREEERESKKHFKRSECGEIKIEAKNVFIHINCKEKRKEKMEY